MQNFKQIIKKHSKQKPAEKKKNMFKINTQKYKNEIKEKTYTYSLHIVSIYNYL